MCSEFLSTEVHVWAWCSACRSPRQVHWAPCCFPEVLLLGQILLCRLFGGRCFEFRGVSYGKMARHLEARIGSPVVRSTVAVQSNVLFRMFL